MNLENVSLVVVAKVRLEVLVLIQKVEVGEGEAPHLEMLDQRREWQLLQRVMVSNVMLQAEEAEEAVLKIVKPATGSAEVVPQTVEEEEEERQEPMHCLMEEAEEEVEQEALKMVRARMVAETLTKVFLTSAGEVASFL